MKCDAWRRIAGVLLAMAWIASGSAGWARESPVIPGIAASELPREARTTLALIERGGPFPHQRDGSVFGNFERRLPPKERGYYREYTVPTPGLTHRGARRIVTGKGGERYYTDDHYRSFKRVRDP